MSLQTLTVIVVGLLALSVNGLRCKCTQSSNKAPCINGVCDVDNGACLALEHPTSGKLYACSTSALPEGECNEKQTKSGVNVRYCSCSVKDFCNHQKWPENSDDGMDTDEDLNGASQSFSNLPLLFITLAIFMSLLGFQ